MSDRGRQAIDRWGRIAKPRPFISRHDNRRARDRFDATAHIDKPRLAHRRPQPRDIVGPQIVIAQHIQFREARLHLAERAGNPIDEPRLVANVSGQRDQIGLHLVGQTHDLIEIRPLDPRAIVQVGHMADRQAVERFG